MTGIKHLERPALQAHRRGDTWATFWQQYGQDAIALEPHHRQRFKRLTDRLLSLVTSGNLDGMEPAGEPWLGDDVQVEQAVDDTQTAARCLWPMQEAESTHTHPGG